MRRTGLLSAIGFALIVVLALPVPGRAAGEPVDIEKMILEAKTPADHEAIAAYYDQQAADARAKAAEHRKMGESYRKAGGALQHKSTSTSTARRWCGTTTRPPATTPPWRRHTARWPRRRIRRSRGKVSVEYG